MGQGWKADLAHKHWLGMCLLMAAGATLAGENGLQLRSTSASDDGWSRIQGRLTLGVHGATLYTAPTIFDSSPTRLHSLSLLGDYYLTRPLGSGGGLRATGGVLLGPRNLLWGGLPAQGAFQIGRRSDLGGASPSDDDNSTVPYFGIGYTGLSLRGGWGLAVDFGLVALNSRSAGLFGNALGSGPGLDGMRDLRLSPILQLGVSYSF